MPERTAAWHTAHYMWGRILRGVGVGIALLLLGALFFNPLMALTGDVLARGYAQRIVTQYPARLRQDFSRRELQYVPYADLPECVKEGIVSVEDKRFYQDRGIDPIALARVLLMSFHNDHVDHGGSTLTQQLAREIIQEPRGATGTLANLLGVVRVLRYALVVDHDFTKPEILELYLNSTYFGRGAYGIAQAAQAYFHADLEHLTFGQCVYLTGLPQAPSYFGANPSGPAAHARYLHVLSTMVRNGYVSSTTAATLGKTGPFSSAP